jgi:RNA polymerase subunit RPABC4/transcription elongation factor Spt4
MHCENLIPGDSNICPFCGNENPFSLSCPKCKKDVEEGYKLCPNCGFGLSVTCPHCGSTIYPTMKCPECKNQLLVVCSNKKCREMQLISNKFCKKCGKELK